MLIKSFFFLIFLILISSCNQKSTEIKRLSSWIYSIENQYFSKWEEEVSHHPDSVYNSFRNEKYELISEEFNLIKKISENGINRIELTQKEASSYPFLKNLIKKENEYVRIKMFPLDPLHPLENYILMYDFNSDWHKTIQFFSKNHKLGEYKASIKTILEAEIFDEKTLIIGQVFQSGTGLYWLQNHFFKFTKERVIPVFQTVSSSYQNGWSFMDFGISSKIVSKQPLKIAYEKEIQFRDSTNKVVFKFNKTDTVLFDWNAKQECFEPNKKSKTHYRNYKSFYIGADLAFLIYANAKWFKSLLKTEKGIDFVNQLYELRTK